MHHLNKEKTETTTTTTITISTKEIHKGEIGIGTEVEVETAIITIGIILTIAHDKMAMAKTAKKANAFTATKLAIGNEIVTNE